MSWRISFKHDATHDVVHASFSQCLLVSATDVEQWRQDMEEGLAPFGRKVDLVLDLDGLEVSFTAGRHFSKARRELLERYALRVCGFGGDEMTQLFFTTSGNVFQPWRMPHAASRTLALATVLAQRGDTQPRSTVSSPAPRSAPKFMARLFLRRLALG
ncbi:hypothetical protein [Hyalangium sp.]|uniref:hypothetical protein n=1 Tax=Hyalangium sp. TaxID=2028555 RepID=UPI002D5AD1ED|nr:hypothetical protein [Hyalangium sp.]HYH96130.1 hypothetical protein [Hyalangium sp.]